MTERQAAGANMRQEYDRYIESPGKPHVKESPIMDVVKESPVKLAIKDMPVKEAIVSQKESIVTKAKEQVSIKTTSDISDVDKKEKNMIDTKSEVKKSGIDLNLAIEQAMRDALSKDFESIRSTMKASIDLEQDKILADLQKNHETVKATMKEVESKASDLPEKIRLLSEKIEDISDSVEKLEKKFSSLKVTFDA